LLIDLARDVSPKYAVLYNGPACGASAPDHLHVQMVFAKNLPFLRERRGLTFSKKYLLWNIKSADILIVA